MESKSEFRIERKKLVIGLLLVATGVLMPAILPAKCLGIMETIRLAVAEWQNGYLLLAAWKLVLLNSLRSFPYYVGTFLIIQAITMENSSIRYLKNIALSPCIVILVYQSILWIYGISYDFAVPTVLLIVLILIVDRMDLSMINIGKKLLIIILLILAVQFLDVMPGLNASLFGRGELSHTVKTVAEFMESEVLLQEMCLAFTFVFGVAAALMGYQLHLENILRRTKKEMEEEREKVISTQRQLLETRVNKEQQFLVHDLKAPLTSIQIWTDLAIMKTKNNNCGECGDYLAHIDHSIANMNLLISEIMDAHVRSVFTVNEVVKLFSRQTSPSHYGSLIRLECSCGEEKIEVNRTNFVRALTNLADNAANSIHHDHGEIQVNIAADGPCVCFAIKDNGEGIRPEMLNTIWDMGVSGRKSTGVGLFFVRNVVNELGGSIAINSEPGKGTEVALKIPIYSPAEMQTE